MNHLREVPAGAIERSMRGEAAAVPPNKKIVTIRIDADVLAWLKGRGPGYQTRVNQLLREHMLAEQARQDG